RRFVITPQRVSHKYPLEKDTMMSDGLTLSAEGAAQISDNDRDELIRNIRAIVQDVENLYRPTRAEMPSHRVSSDPVMLGLYGARDGLIAAENSILKIALGSASEEKLEGVHPVDIEIDKLFDQTNPDERSKP
ncbi:hypothetical protein NOCD_22075, partial [Nocardioides cavernae]|uniref:hypothetical protein n=2 Tax=Bacteria TaxID=2 RepID=UPI00200FBB23